MTDSTEPTGPAPGPAAGEAIPPGPPRPPLPPPAGLPALPRGFGTTGKAILIGALIIVMLLPLLMVQDVISERQYRYRDAGAEIGASWGKPQSLAGPVLAIPYVVLREDDKGKVERLRYEAYALPEALDVKAELKPQMLYRGLFQAVVYTVSLKAAGQFARPDLTGVVPPEAEVLWREASILVGVSDPRSIQATVALRWGDAAIPFEPATVAVAGLPPSVLKARLPPLDTLAREVEVPFAFDLELNGSDNLSILPVGKQNTVAVQAPWASPSFFGAFLPEEREVTEAAFSARWSVSYFGRGYGQAWTDQTATGDLAQAMAESRLGVALIDTVTPYQQVERSAKYGILFLVLTFLVYFLFELVSGARIHVIQYGLLGLALCVFYLLLLSFSEQWGFGLAYLASAGAVVLQTTTYTLATVRKRGNALLFGVLLAWLYGFLYLVLQLESMALMVGSIALFAALSAVMWFTRRIDWYNVGPAQRPAG
ncbi:cell envelope integrity protein CreD [Zavarzinia sp. CC-PAN008]|uniref:cell envelope integrity protein CreD n=1 Tax=Zavarzinia sp. CC-PAN008 TaxID=3243332 RepID=UPI003F743E35